MNDRKNRPISDAEWYFRKDLETKRFMKYSFNCAGSTMCTGPVRR